MGAVYLSCLEDIDSAPLALNILLIPLLKYLLRVRLCGKSIKWGHSPMVIYSLNLVQLWIFEVSVCFKMKLIWWDVGAALSIRCKNKYLGWTFCSWWTGTWAPVAAPSSRQNHPAICQLLIPSVTRAPVACLMSVGALAWPWAPKPMVCVYRWITERHPMA